MHTNKKVNMTKSKTIKEVAEIFWQLEDKYDLINYEVDNIKLWQVLRWELFSLITKEIFKFDEAHGNSNKFHKFKQIPKMLYNSIFNSAMFSRDYEVLVFPHERVRLVDNKYIDIYTNNLVKSLKEKGKNLLVLEKPCIQKHYIEKQGYIKYLDDSILYSNIVSGFAKDAIDENDNFLKSIEQNLKVLFDINIDLIKICNAKLKTFKAYYDYYIILLKRLKPKEIYVIVSYAYPWLIKAAKELNIRVIELQHGAYSKYHLGYCYKKDSKLEYFPDELWVWNQYWKDLIWLPINQDNIKIYPFTYQDNEIKKYKSMTKTKNQVVVLSQGTISNQMAKIILNNFDFFQDKIIKYKLHPGEIQRYKNYKYLTKLLQKENVELIIEGNLYQLLATSEYQVGVYSTAIYEGLEFGLKTILCNLPNIEFMENLIEQDKVYKVLYDKSI